RAGLQGGGHRMTLGALAMGDDADSGSCTAHRPDRVRAGHPAVADRAAAQVEDRHVDVADVADHLEGLLAALALVHLEIASERLAHAEPDERVGVGHEALWAGRAQGSILAQPGPSG